jgi:hypothetical protein
MESKILCLFCLTVGFALSAAFPQVGHIPHPAPKVGGYAPDHYFQYINVPKHKVYEWGYKRGNKDHFREEYLSQKDHTFKAKLKWGDSYDGHGEMYYDYNHAPKYKEEHYKPAKPVYKPAPYSPSRR